MPPPMVPMRQLTPSGSLMPAASMTRPLMRVSRPAMRIGAMLPASSACLAMKRRQLSTRSFIVRVCPLATADAGEHTLPARLDGGVDVTAGGLQTAAAALHRGVLDQMMVAGFELVVEVLAHQLDVVRMQMDAHLALGDVLQGLAHGRRHRLGTGREGLADHLAGQHDGEFDDLVGDLA